MTHTSPIAPGTSPEQQAEWREKYGAPPDLDEQAGHILAYVAAIRAEDEWTHEVYNRVVRQLARDGVPILPKAQVRRGYLALVKAGDAERDVRVLRRLRMKPTRTLSGVAPVTVLTKPYPCPGKCIFCPDDVRMPKSYLSNEPGAMRALMLDFDPYDQTRKRIAAMRRIGHAVDKVELLVLGGTWSAYPKAYREWFVRRCFEALNDGDGLISENPLCPSDISPLQRGDQPAPDENEGSGGKEPPDGFSGEADPTHQRGRRGSAASELERLFAEQRRNERSAHRNVGLTIETRPDRVTVDEVRHLRQLGVTRVQLGVQSLDDDVLRINRRGHTVEDARRAVRLLRGAGFKITLHWMPNLLGATPEGDLADFARFWSDPALRPDEMKLYPTGLLRGTALYAHYEAGAYHPYDEPTLTDLLAACKAQVPVYCRLNRVMRDIPAPDIADGVTRSNLRQIVQERLRAAGTPCRCIRCREVRRERVDPAAVAIAIHPYATDHSTELFIQAIATGDMLAGFARLSLPGADAPFNELDGAAIIRQVQVYGPLVGLDAQAAGRAQHQGIGGRLIERAMREARAAGFRRVAVIAAVGTRDYYRRFGFEVGELYMGREI